MCVWWDYFVLVIQASISSILRLINPIEEPAEEKKELEVEAVYTGESDSMDTEEELLEGEEFYATIQETIQNSMIGRKQGERVPEKSRSCYRNF